VRPGDGRPDDQRNRVNVTKIRREWSAETNPAPLTPGAEGGATKKKTKRKKKKKEKKKKKKEKKKKKGRGGGSWERKGTLEVRRGQKQKLEAERVSS